jgi:hypothetical protein
VEVDGENGEDGAELDQHLERFAGRLEAQEIAAKQQMPGGGNRDEFRQTLDQAEQDHLPNGHQVLRYIEECKEVGLPRTTRNPDPRQGNLARQCVRLQPLIAEP